ncbi:MAG: hypothetical protein ACREQT_17670 [Candidatus Binataceae bacterium]
MAALPAIANGAESNTLIDCKISELHYRKFKALRDVALKIKRGTITAFIGPSDAVRVQRCAV